MKSIALITLLVKHIPFYLLLSKKQTKKANEKPQSKSAVFFEKYVCLNVCPSIQMSECSERSQFFSFVHVDEVAAL